MHVIVVVASAALAGRWLVGRTVLVLIPLLLAARSAVVAVRLLSGLAAEGLPSGGVAAGDVSAVRGAVIGALVCVPIWMVLAGLGAWLLA